jgi:integrase
MSALAPTLQAFFSERLIDQRHASPNTIAAYRDTFKLLLAFAATQRGRQPSQLDIGDLDATLIAAFLTHLESERGNSIRTRNARLAAIHSLFRYAQHRHPEHAADIQRVLAIPPKRAGRALVTFLEQEETEALLTAPCSYSRSRPGCASPSSWGSTAATCTSQPARTSAAMAKDANSASPRSPRSPSPCCASGSRSAPATPTSRSSRPAAATGSAATDSNADSRNT